MRPFVSILLLSLFSGCLESSFDFTPVNINTAVHYTIASNYSGPNDAYEIIGISPAGDKLNVRLSYSGGCGRHSFNVVWNGEIGEDAVGKEIFLKIFHHNNDDACEALLKPVITIDFGEALGGFIPDEETKITIQNASNGRAIEIDPILLKITQGNDCSLKATFTNSLCGFGVWQNNWFRMEDSLGLEKAVWLQPVALNPEISGDIPAQGKYELGLSLLVGYQTPADPSCLTIPEGLVIPVEVNCIYRIN